MLPQRHSVILHFSMQVRTSSPTALLNFDCWYKLFSFLDPPLYSQTNILSVGQHKQVTDSRDGGLTLKHGLGSLDTKFLDGLGGNAVNSLGKSSRVIRLAGVDNASTGEDNAGLSEVVLAQEVELGVGNGLLDILLAGLAISDGLENLNGLLGTLANRGGGTAELDGHETGIGVYEVGGVDSETSSASGGLGQHAEAGSPLDSGLATEESSQDSVLRLGRVVTGAGEGNDDRVTGGGVCSLLTTKVLGGLGLEGLAVSGGGGHIVEELANPLGEAIGRGTVGDEGDIGLGISDIGVAGNVLLVHVLLVGS
ncbi:hypothetical protein HG531_002118 [Fusarium graminearum]|nr:hypothetical protein HG531_002118 [Fusarium graminearum]